MKFAKEFGRDIVEEIAPLLVLHYKEIAHYQDIPLEPALDKYLSIEDEGLLRVYTARKDGKLVGYSIYFIRHNLHYSSSKQALQDILFIHPEHRGTGGKLIAWCDEQLRAEGVQAVYHHVKAAHNFGPLLERMGYKLIDLIYARRLDT